MYPITLPATFPSALHGCQRPLVSCARNAAIMQPQYHSHCAGPSALPCWCCYQRPDFAIGSEPQRAEPSAKAVRRPYHEQQSCHEHRKTWTNLDLLADSDVYLDVWLVEVLTLLLLLLTCAAKASD
jgi:hypothetical protein